MIRLKVHFRKIGEFVRILSTLFLFVIFGIHAEVADLVVFSYDRPLQLYALLESVEDYMQGIGEMHVIYRTSGPEFDAGYAIIQHRFNHITYHKQGANPQADFKPLTMQATFGSRNAYVIFAVDDNVVKDYVDLAECVELLERYLAHGFYLRLGKNLTRTIDRVQPVPELQELNHGACMWQFGQAEMDWGYPNTVDMTVYKKKDILHHFERISFHSPNSLEGNWAACADLSQRGLSYQTTKIVNLPLNLVQTDCHNPNMNFLSSRELLDIFLAGLKMDIRPLFKVNNSDAHMYYEPIFIKNSFVHA